MKWFGKLINLFKKRKIQQSDESPDNSKVTNSNSGNLESENLKSENLKPGKLKVEISRSELAEENNNKTNNITKQLMAKKTVITKVLDAEAQDGIIEFPQNRTLYVDQFTDQAPTTDEDREGFKPKNMKEVFEHYQPSKEGIALENEEGGSIYEDFIFRQIKDFEDEQLIEQSAHLSGEKAKIDAYNSIIRQLQKNKPLRNALKDPASRAAFLNVLKSLKAEIEDAE